MMKQLIRNKPASRVFMTALFLVSCSAFAQFDKLIDQFEPTQKSGAKKNKTENLIRTGAKLFQSLQPIGYKEEMAIGGAVALEAMARFGGLYQNPVAEKYVTSVGSAVALTSDRPDIPYYFGILNTDEPNAFACPGGYIFVSRGLLKLVKNEAQLAGVLGHEIAHVSKKHALEAIRNSKILSSASEVTLSALDKDPKMFDAVVKETVSMILDRGLGQAKEIEADSVGTHFALRVGYQPEGLKTFLSELDRVSKGQKGGLFKTHPNTPDRIRKLDLELKKPDYRESKNLPLLAERLTQSFSGAL